MNRALRVLSASYHVLAEGTTIVLPDPDGLRALVGGGPLAPYRRNTRRVRGETRPGT